MEKKKVLRYFLATVLAIFGLITLYLSSSVIFDLFGIREKEGHYVLIVVWANFLSSIIYLVAAFGFIKNKIFTVNLLYISAAILIVAFAALLVHIYLGGVYETKTIAAMVFRILLTIAFALSAYFTIKKTGS